MNAEARFWAKVSRSPSPTGCLLWTAALHRRSGYGVLWAGRTRFAHVFAWELEHGPVAPGLVLMHACDVRHCVNVNHLRVGTQAQNLQDMSQKGRAGDKGAKLTRAEREAVVRMLREGVHAAKIAEQFAVQVQSVWRIKRLLKASDLLGLK